MIKTILIFLALTSNAFAFGLLNQMDAGSVESATCSSSSNIIDVNTTDSATSTLNYCRGQEFSPGTNTTLHSFSFDINNTDGTYDLYFDDDADLGDSPIATCTGVSPVGSKVTCDLSADPPTILSGTKYIIGIKATGTARAVYKSSSDQYEGTTYHYLSDGDSTGCNLVVVDTDWDASFEVNACQ